MEINKITLAFPGKMEKKFHQDYFNSSIRLLRASFLLGAVYYSVFAFLDILVMPEMKTELFLIRFLLVCPAILIVFGLSFTKNFYKWWQLGALLATVISGIGIVAMTLITPEIGRNHYYAGIMLVLFYCYMLIRLRFIWASLAGWLIFIAYVASTLFFANIGSRTLSINLFFLGSANVLGMFGSYALEFYARKDFYSRYLLGKEHRKVEKANAELEEKVSEKTKELQLDIQQRKDVEKELRVAKNVAEESNRLKSAFLLNLSHEIRTPLNGIFGFANLLQSPDLTGEEQNEYIKLIQISGNRMLNTVTDLVEISRIETGQIDLHYSMVNVISEFNAICNSFTDAAISKGLEFRLEINLDDNTSTIRTDSEKLQVILNKIIGNAIKYTDKGLVKVVCAKKDDHLLCSIQDSGIGIPKNRQQAIFKCFEQADIGDSRAFEGSGLGLAISKAYVEMLGGEIWVESEEGAGATFFFSLPWETVASDNKIIENTDFETLLAETAEKPKILIAEDDDVTFQHLSIILEKYAGEIIHATNGEKAVEICRHNPNIDLILMDIKMPVLNGFEATEKIREFNKDVKIIAQTAYALSGDNAKAMEAGCNDYITKPINNKILLSKINKLIFKNTFN